MLELREYSLSELKKKLHISERQWNERKAAVLEYLKMFFNYKIQMRGRSYIFIIKAQYSEYELMPSKNKAEQIQDFYIKKIDKILGYKPRNIGANIAREIE